MSRLFLLDLVINFTLSCADSTNRSDIDFCRSIIKRFLDRYPKVKLHSCTTIHDNIDLK